MKKKLALISLLSLLSCLLFACSWISQKTFVKGPNQVTLQYEDKKIATITVFTEKSFKDWGVEDEEQASQLMTEMSETWGQVAGADKIETSISEREASFKVTLETRFLDADEMFYAGIFGGIQDFTDPEEVEKQLKEVGYQEK